MHPPTTVCRKLATVNAVSFSTRATFDVGLGSFCAVPSGNPLSVRFGFDIYGTRVQLKPFAAHWSLYAITVRKRPPKFT